MTERGFPQLNSITLSGEVSSTPARSSRGGEQSTRFTLSVSCSSGATRPARISVIVPPTLEPELAEKLRIGAEVIVEGAVSSAPGRGIRGLSMVQIVASRVHVLSAIHTALKGEISSGHAVSKSAADAPTPARKRTRRGVPPARERRRPSRVSAGAPRTTQAGPAVDATGSTAPITPTLAIPSEQSKPARAARPTRRKSAPRRRRPHAGARGGVAGSAPEAGLSKTAEPAPPVNREVEATEKSEAPVSDRPAPRKKTIRRRTRVAGRSTRAAGAQTAKSRTSRAASATVKRAQDEKKKRRESAEADDSPFELTQHESPFDPFLVDDKE
ncbi:MAG: hypothetical protein ACE5GA_02015 [Candidatus Zixiibacteriota bacterium]